MNELIGTSFGRYHILEQLGEGGMANVFKAYDTRLETDVAVKVIRTENIVPGVLERTLKRFEREAKSLARLTHPNIVKVMDYGEYESKPYLVMEYLPGGTLKEKLGAPMFWQDAAQLLIPIAEALDYAHSQNMIHRDVKPSNILLTQSGQPMLTDFGIAKILDLDETQELTSAGTAVGTPEYMAPEQATARTVDHRADIYALGVVLYEMVTGRKPFIADTPLAVLFKQASDPLPNPRIYVPDLPEEVEKVLLTALAKQPADRYQRMEEFAAALKGLEAGKPVGKPASALELSSRTAPEIATLVAFTPERPVNMGLPPRSVALPAPPKSNLNPAWLWGIGALCMLSFFCLCVALSIKPLSAALFPTDTPTPTSTPTFTPTPTSTPTLTPTPTFTPTATPIPIVGEWTITYQWSGNDPGTATITFYDDGAGFAKENSTRLDLSWSFENGELTFTFTDAPAIYTGKLIGGRLEGTMTDPSNDISGTWSAVRN